MLCHASITSHGECTIYTGTVAAARTAAGMGRQWRWQAAQRTDADVFDDLGPVGGTWYDAHASVERPAQDHSDRGDTQPLRDRCHLLRPLDRYLSSVAQRTHMSGVVVMRGAGAGASEPPPISQSE